MKKAFALLLTIVLIISSIGTLTSCGKTQTSAVDKLSAEEYEIFLIVTENLYRFKDPGSVIIGLAYKAVDGCAVLYINANDSLGIQRGEFYCVFIEDYFYTLEYDHSTKKFAKGTMISTDDASYAIAQATREDRQKFMSIINGLSDSPHYSESALGDALIEYRIEQGIE